MNAEQKAEIKRQIQAGYAWNAEERDEERQDGITPQQFYERMAETMTAIADKTIECMDGTPVERSDGRRYASLVAAVRSLRADGVSVTRAQIIRAVKTGCRCGGYRWCEPGHEVKPFIRRGRRVERIDTGEVFANVTFAAQSVGVKTQTFRNAIDANAPAGGTYWRWIDDMSEKKSMLAKKARATRRARKALREQRQTAA